MTTGSAARRPCKTMANREWAGGEQFSLADCAAAPFLFYTDWTQPIGATHPHVLAYRRRLLARPSFARAVGDALERLFGSRMVNASNARRFKIIVKHIPDSSTHVF